jgi:hypothetical protein
MHNGVASCVQENVKGLLNLRPSIRSRPHASAIPSPIPPCLGTTIRHRISDIDGREKHLHMRTLPGFMMFSGSTAFLTAHISRIVAGPSSSTRYFFLPMPTPCSPVPTPKPSSISHPVTRTQSEGTHTCRRVLARGRRAGATPRRSCRAPRPRGRA